ncbi:MAG: hypothetical protein SVG88_01885 [Halobacteriales archaeon]|nr:hypothetical protein [Halobacteriales archaeon]
MAPTQPAIDAVENGDRFRHITRGYYWDTDAITIWRLALTVGTLIAYPPVGVFLFVFFSVRAITGDPAGRLDDAA